MDQTIDKIILVSGIEALDTSEVNTVIDREKGSGYLCISQSIVYVPNESSGTYTVSLGFSKIENMGNIGG